MDIISINNTVTKNQSKQRPRLEFFCGGSEKSRFNGFTKCRFKIFLNFSYEEELTVSFISF